jgi:hypothetical protein
MCNDFDKVEATTLHPTYRSPSDLIFQYAKSENTVRTRGDLRAPFSEIVARHILSHQFPEIALTPAKRANRTSKS